mgnify:CR=1 FL=1
MHKTLGVVVERKVKHPILGKYLLRSKKYSVHNIKSNYISFNDNTVKKFEEVLITNY